MDPDFLAAGKENEGKFTISDENSIREVVSGKQPGRIWGPPFPTIDPKDPKAGFKIAWNFFYQSPTMVQAERSRRPSNRDSSTGRSRSGSRRRIP
jgi:hypothetical protein